MVRKIERVMQHPIWNKITNVLFPILLVLFSFVHINEGITVTDTGYNYGNFLYFDLLDDMWKFSTYLANGVGAFFTHLPFGQTMLGLNFYTGLFKILACLGVYFFCIRVCKMRKEAVFVGELIALGFCWCPTALIYNYLTYFLFHLGALCLYVALVKDKKHFFVLAGVFLGLNLFVRLPNVAEIALIFVVWFTGFLKKKKCFTVIKETLWCILGYGIGAGSVFLYLICRYGFKRYVNGILALFAMTDEAESYTVMAMVSDTFKAYFSHAFWIVLGIALLVFGIVLFGIGKEKCRKVKGCILVFATLLLFYMMKRRGVFTCSYRWYDSIYGVGILFMLALFMLCGYVFLSRQKKTEERILACIVCIIVLITPLGSNNNVYSPMNNLFLAAPFFVNFVWKLLFCEKRGIIVGKRTISLAPFKIVLSMFVLLVCVQSFLFGSSFVFRDGITGEDREETVSENYVLQGMYTTKQNGQNLQELNDYLEKHELKGKDAILFGNVPSCAFYFELTPVLSSTWPDLQSYSLNKFQEEIDDLKIAGEKPLIIMSSNPVDIGAEETCKEFLKEKYAYLTQYMSENQYEQVFSNEAFLLYRSK